MKPKPESKPADESPATVSAPEAKPAAESATTPTPPPAAAAPSLDQLIAQSGAFEKVYAAQIHERMQRGLSREQAISVTMDQARHDAALKAAQ